MGDKTVVADLDPVGEPALDHVPPKRSLAEAKQENPGEWQDQRARQPPPDQKPNEGDGIGCATIRPNNRCKYSQK